MTNDGDVGMSWAYVCGRWGGTGSPGPRWRRSHGHGWRGDRAGGRDLPCLALVASAALTAESYGRFEGAPKQLQLISYPLPVTKNEREEGGNLTLATRASGHRGQREMTMATVDI